VKRVAVFVEGQTELIFIERLIGEYFGYHQVAFEKELERAGQIVALKGGYEPDQSEYFFLLVNCEGDGRVVSAIRDRAERLLAADYDVVIGIRDLHPLRRDQEASLIAGATQVLGAIGDLDCRIVVAVMEIEAWFLLDPKLPLAISGDLTPVKVIELSGHDLQQCDVSAVDHPAGVVSKMYVVAGGRYRKKLADTHGIVDRLCIDELCLVQRARSPSFDRLLTIFDDIAASD
jgi:hypothetical protein